MCVSKLQLINGFYSCTCSSCLSRPTLGTHKNIVCRTGGTKNGWDSRPPKGDDFHCHICLFLAMTLVSEIVCLRIVTIILFVLLGILTIYVLYDALRRCKEVESRLTQELSEMALLTDVSDHED